MVISKENLEVIYDNDFMWFVMGALVSADNVEPADSKIEALKIIQEFADSGYMKPEDTVTINNLIQTAYKIIERDERDQIDQG